MSSRETSDSAKKPRLSGPTGFGGDDSASAARASGSNFPEASSAATATSAIDPTVQAALDNLARNIKKEFEGQLNDQKKEFEGQLNTVNERISQICDAFAPVVHHALLETCIYYYVGKYESDNIKVKQNAVRLCLGIMANLHPNMHATTEKIRWDGPEHFDPYVSVMATLGGIVAYIDVEDENCLKNADFEERNQLAHDGNVLNAMFKTPDGKKRVRTQHFDETKARAKAQREQLEQKLEAGGDLPQGVTNGIDQVVAAFGRKGVTIDGGAKKEVIQALEKIV